MNERYEFQYNFQLSIYRCKMMTKTESAIFIVMNHLLDNCVHNSGIDVLVFEPQTELAASFG